MDIKTIFVVDKNFSRKFFLVFNVHHYFRARHTISITLEATGAVLVSNASFPRRLCVGCAAFPYQQQIVLTARDDYTYKPTVLPHFWNDSPEIAEAGVLANKDLTDSNTSTVFGITKRGRFAVLTMVRTRSQAAALRGGVEMLPVCVPRIRGSCMGLANDFILPTSYLRILWNGNFVKRHRRLSCSLIQESLDKFDPFDG